MRNLDLLMKANTAAQAAIATIPQAALDAMTDATRAHLFDDIGALVVTAMAPASSVALTDPATIRTTFEVIVLHEADTMERRLTARDMGMKDILDWINDGDAIGTVRFKRLDVLEPEAVRDALLDVGNDGTFFEALDDV